MNSLTAKLHEWWQRNNKNYFTMEGLNFEQWFSIFSEHQKLNEFFSNKPLILVFEDESTLQNAEKYLNNFKYLKIIAPTHNPYESIIDLNHEGEEFTSNLTRCASKDFDVLLLNYAALNLRVPKLHYLRQATTVIKKSEQLPQQELKQQLLELGYQESMQAGHPGTYSQRGEIFDLYLPVQGPVRLIYFDDQIEEIFPIDIETNKSIKDQPLDLLQLETTAKNFFNETNIQNLRKNIPIPKPQFKNKYLARKEFFEAVNSQHYLDNFIHLFSLLFGETTTLSTYFGAESLVIFFNKEKAEILWNSFREQLSESFNLVEKDTLSDCFLPGPEYFFNLESMAETLECPQLIVEHLGVHSSIEKEMGSLLQFKPLTLVDFLGTAIQDKTERIEKLFMLINKRYHELDQIFYFGEKNKDRFDFLLENYQISHAKIVSRQSPLTQSFFLPNNKSLYLSESDLFHKQKKKKTSKRVSDDLFAEQIATLKPNDFVIHKIHGVGKFLGVEKIDISQDDTDFVVIEYKDQDKVYIPVYHFNQVQKYADENAVCVVADLKSKKFEQSKQKAKSAAKKLAFDLLKLQAERESFQGREFNSPGEQYFEFEQGFPFTLTPDQETAINDVMADLSSSKPTDRLICGDVGFGKTEVAMRAAFKVVEDGAQVAILVPTTILCLQHFMNFKERFKNFPVRIEYLSRLKSAKESKEILESIKEGKVDIIIGTHKLLSESVEYKDLGLIIVDEEHRFGVNHKEKLKTLKANTDFITLTATPIPRTLQLSFMGIKQLSLIKTPPPRRQSISSYIIREDYNTIKSAIQTELNRAGQVFFIHNRVQDIELVVAKIHEMVPKAKIVFAHGQLNEKDMEKRIQDFYNKKYDILVSTTIVESGIDIPTANTMIVNNADKFGLAQLHQLRGRIGRASRKAYCYFVIPRHKNLKDMATKRLEALLKYSGLGSGFAIANSDLDIRGAGNILGAEQSGHIQNIGLELYMELLQEAMSEIKGETRIADSTDADINLPFPSFIPDWYIKDQQQRLKYYKRISNSTDPEDLSEIKDDLVDIYGKLPGGVENLFTQISIRNSLKSVGVKTAKFSKNKLHLFFHEEFLVKNESFRDKMVHYFLNRTLNSKLQPNYSVIIHKNFNSIKDCLELSSTITKNLLV